MQIQIQIQNTCTMIKFKCADLTRLQLKKCNIDSIGQILDQALRPRPQRWGLWGSPVEVEKHTWSMNWGYKMAAHT